jgi:hypothetical protein
VRMQRAQFKVGDVYIPTPDELLRELHSDEELSGSVVDTSESSVDGTTYVIVEVRGISKPVLVPANKIRLLPQDIPVPPEGRPL